MKPRTFVKIEQIDQTDEYKVECQSNLTDLELVSGPAIEPNNIRVGIINPLGRRVSGVQCKLTLIPTFGIFSVQISCENLVEQFSSGSY